jgi:hypothetical protein
MCLQHSEYSELMGECDGGAEKVEAEKVEAEKVEAEKVEAEKVLAEKLGAEEKMVVVVVQSALGWKILVVQKVLDDVAGQYHP